MKRKDERTWEGQGSGGEREEDGAGTGLPRWRRVKSAGFPLFTGHPWGSSNLPDVTAAITSWFWSFSIPSRTAFIPDHVGIPGRQCCPPNIPWDGAGMGLVCPCQEMWAELPIQQSRRRGHAGAPSKATSVMFWHNRWKQESGHLGSNRSCAMKRIWNLGSIIFGFWISAPSFEKGGS